MNFYKTTSLLPNMGVLAAVFVLTVLHAAFAGDARDQTSEGGISRRQFAGWDGVAFYCSLRPDEQQTTRALCEWAEERMRVLADPVKIPLIAPTHQNAEERAKELVLAGKSGALDLELTITLQGVRPIAVYVSLAAHKYYSNAAQQEPSPSPRGTPRPGDLVLWERAFLGSAARWSGLEFVLRQRLDAMLIKFVEDFSAAR
jgi:hypothetical protein